MLASGCRTQQDQAARQHSRKSPHLLLLRGSGAPGVPGFPAPFFSPAPRLPLLRNATAALLAFLTACATPRPDLPTPLTGVPGTQPGDEWVAAARGMAEREQDRESLAELERILARWPDQVDAHRLRQDLLRERGRIALLRTEAEQRLDGDGGSAPALYLAGRIAPRTGEKLQWFERALAADRSCFWAWLGLAHTLRSTDSERALAVYAELDTASGQHPLVGIARAAALRAALQVAEAAAIYERLRGDRRVPGIGDLGLAELHAHGERQDLGWAALMSSLRVRPYDAGVRQLVRDALARGVTEDRVHQILDLLRVDPRRFAELVAVDAPLLAHLHLRLGDAFAARAELERSGGPPGTPAERRLWREVVLRCGDLRAYLDELAASLPRDVIDDPRNQVRSAWRTLLDGPWMSGEEPLARPEDAVALIEALEHVGLIEPAARVLALARLRTSDAPTRARLGAIEERIGRRLSFERALRRVVYQGYLAGSEPRSLDSVLDELRRIGREIFGEDVVGEPRRFQIPFVGEMVDPFSPGIGTFVSGWNRHLVLGQRDGRPVEAMLLTRLSLADVAEHADLPLPARTREVVAEDRRVRSLGSVYGGDLAGVALFNHYIVDYDAVREWAWAIRERRRVAREDGEVVLRDPLPQRIGELETLGVDWRLSLTSPVADPQLESAVLDMIRWHEHAHLVDAFHYLPPEENLLRILGLLFSFGFDALAIESEFEARAETAALALSPHTELVLAHIAGFLDGEPGDSPHARGFRNLALQIARRAEARGLPGAHPSQWHRLDPAAARAIGRELLGELW